MREIVNAPLYQSRTGDVEIAPNNVDNVRPKPKRLVDGGILAESEPGFFTRLRP